MRKRDKDRKKKKRRNVLAINERKRKRERKMEWERKRHTHTYQKPTRMSTYKFLSMKYIAKIFRGSACCSSSPNVLFLIVFFSFLVKLTWSDDNDCGCWEICDCLLLVFNIFLFYFISLLFYTLFLISIILMTIK